MQIVVTGIKGGCGKSTLTACLAEVWGSAIRDHALQGTITVISEITGRHQPSLYAHLPSTCIIHDTPYHAAQFDALVKGVDRIVIPTKLTHADLVSLSPLLDKLDTLNVDHKATIVFNQVCCQYTQHNNQLRNLYNQEYGFARIAQTEIPHWIGFSNVWVAPLPRRERQQIERLIDELKKPKN